MGEQFPMEFQNAGNVKSTLDILEAWLDPFISDSTEQDIEKMLVWSQRDIRRSLLREIWNELEVGHTAASSSEQLEAYYSQSDDTLVRNQGSQHYSSGWDLMNHLIALIFRE